MLFQKLAIVSALAALVAAQDIGQDDIPRECTAICAPVVTLARDCDNRNENDPAELDCVCRAPGANTMIPACDACVAQFQRPDVDDDNDDIVPDVNDVREVLSRCSFTTASFNPAATASSIMQSIGGNMSAPTPTGGAVVTTTSGGVVMTTTLASAATSAPPQQTTNAASGLQAGAALGLGALGFALGML
ncbi:hypothetical protein IAQ61_011881 [Plenodomus lingam]|uniref:Predicted protein n=1 Tax=Leptosphaeria maculans (strain JN3 / isolate v23.1.3 / race Av1-4-5-6-7-8) TaxID=985895 RepID=E5ABE1_LEPMJ|nr:predicted protein [Plenodomus lingam JN3]KAH9860097.1 hypothetical protein IAQ61_011881 [Plenodomus lingam]CBY00982.1 predicted protein [Plenodomus lingam JN3]